MSIRFVRDSHKTVHAAVTAIVAVAVHALVSVGSDSIATAKTEAREQNVCRNHVRDQEMLEGQVLKRQMWKPKLPYPLWDYNWDDRMTPETTLEAQSKSVDEPVTGVTRHIILIRHGQYDETQEVRNATTRVQNPQSERHS
jgi:hypothetical protein